MNAPAVSIFKTVSLALWVSRQRLRRNQLFLSVSVRSSARLGGDPAIAYGQEHGMSSIVGVSLAQNGADMVLNRLLANAED